ncbi:hypothetical protein PISL3812_02105 [Talaromyces islandicus]|uniref:Uncharacterized protein n=1 Tax=Talaromyces islandicus TaxID=28573 RepID=A0A0U1LNY0_TALIS|nr:hypothetical protein PISL3812_02105 [Talaromyces islandicus]
MYFASSMKSGYQNYYDPGGVNSMLVPYLSMCQSLSDSVHRSGLACAEPNVIDIALLDGNNDLSSDTRIAIWGTWSGLGNEECLKPCSMDGSKYGCLELLDAFKVSNWVDKKTSPDYTDGTQWASKFDVKEAPERFCS